MRIYLTAWEETLVWHHRTHHLQLITSEALNLSAASSAPRCMCSSAYPTLGTDRQEVEFLLHQSLFLASSCTLRSEGGDGETEDDQTPRAEAAILITKHRFNGLVPRCGWQKLNFSSFFQFSFLFFVALKSFYHEKRSRTFSPCESVPLVSRREMRDEEQMSLLSLCCHVSAELIIPPDSAEAHVGVSPGSPCICGKKIKDIMFIQILLNSVTLQLGGIYHCRCGAWITAEKEQ